MSQPARPHVVPDRPESMVWFNMSASSGCTSPTRKRVASSSFGCVEEDPLLALRACIGACIPSQLAGVDRTAELLERLEEEGTDEIGLQASCFGFLHFFLHGVEPIGTHGLLRQRIPVEQRLQMVVVQRLVDLECQPRSYLGLVAVADGLDQQILEACFLEDLAQDGFRAGGEASLECGECETDGTLARAL